MSNYRQDLSGLKFGYWQVLSKAASRHDGKRNRTMWNCLCECGIQREVQTTALTSGKSLSCGCRQKESVSTHGFSDKPLYKMWQTMKQRCENPKATAYASYGARGIKVCDRWQTFTNFLEDVAPRPSKEHTIDRMNVDGDYAPDNFKWATKLEQGNNRRDNVLITANGKTQSVTAWARELGVKKGLLYSRLKAEWPISEVLNPARKQGQKIHK